MTTYFVDSSVKKSGDGLTPETAFKTEKEVWNIIESNAPQHIDYNDYIRNKIISPASICRNCKGTRLTYDFDKAIYICDCCGTMYYRVLGKMIEGVRVHWLGDEIKKEK